MASHRFHKVSLIIFIATFTGCVSNIKLDSAFWENKVFTTGMCLTPNPVEGHVYRDVKGGILPGYVATIDSWDEELTAFVQKFGDKEFVRIKTLFSDELAKRGMRVNPLDDKTCSAILMELQDSKNAKPEVLSKIRKLTDVDCLMVFRVTSWGIMQSGYPLRTRYSSFLTMHGSLLNLHDGKMKWKNIGSWSEKHGERVLGDWDQPPDYPNVAKAMYEGLSRRIKELYDSFFSSISN